MNTLVENIAAKTGVAPARLPGRPANRILVVEDNAFIRELNAQVLERWGQEADDEDHKTNCSYSKQTLRYQQAAFGAISNQ